MKSTKDLLRYQVFSNRLYNATEAENEGTINLSLFAKAKGNNGRDDHDVFLRGVLVVEPEWELSISVSGAPLFVRADEAISLDDVYGTSISALADESKGIWYSPSACLDAVDLGATPRWAKLLSDFLDA